MSVLNSRLLRNNYRRSVGFTIVELLVVIAVITVLIAILLPALSKVREQANRIKCAANLRSIGQALTMYVQQYHYYPSSQYIVNFSVSEAAVWAPRLRPFLDGQSDTFLCPSRDDSFRWSRSGPEPVIQASGHLLELGYAPAEPILHWNVHFSYGYNGEGYRGDLFAETQKGLGIWPFVMGEAPRNAGEMPALRIRFASDMIAVADSLGDGFVDYVITADSDYPESWPGAIHSGGANVLFCDGHVTWYLQPDLVIRDPRTSVDKPKVRMWNNDHRAPGDL